MNNLLYISIILVSTSCNLSKLDKSKTMVSVDTVSFQSKYLFSDVNEIANFESEFFVSNALNNYTIAIINQRFLNLLDCSKESITNSYDPEVMDTIYTFSNQENLLQIYRAKRNDFIFNLEITDAKLKLIGDVNTGMTKNSFCKKFHIKDSINNKVQIVNSEGSMKFLFYFRHNKLKQINGYVYLD